MALADTAKLIVDLSLKGNFSAQLAANRRALTSFDRAITSSQGRAYKAGQQIGTGIKSGLLIAATAVGALTTQVIAGLNQLALLEDATAATNAALKSTKGVSGQTAASIRALAEEYEALNATIDDKVIQAGENVLLTFTRIRQEAFEPALEAALNLSVGMKQDLQTSIVQVGKALNDPIKGLTSLRRIGVQFTEQQEEQIKALVKSGDLLGAQRVILQELGTEFGGRFKAQGETAKGTIAGIGDAVEDLQKSLATALFPTIQKLLPKIRAALADPKVLAFVSKLGQSIADLFSDKNLAEGGRFLGTMFDTAKAAAPVLTAAAGTMLTIVKAAVGLFRSLPEGIQQLAIGAFAINKLTGGLVTNIAGGLISAVISQFKPLMNVNAGVVNVNGGIGPGGPGGPGGGGILGVAKTLLKLAIVPAIVIGFAEAISSLPDRTRELLPSSPSGRGVGAPGRSGLPNFPGANAPGSRANPISVVTVGGFDSRVRSAPGSRLKDDVANLIQLQKGTRNYLDDLFRQAVAGLKTATGAASVQKAVRAALAVVTKRGGALATEKVLIDLKGQLLRTTDPETRRVLRSAIAQVERKLVGRQMVQRQIDKAEKIFKSTESTGQKIKELKVIEKSLEHTSRSGAAKVQAKIDALTKSQKYETRATTEAIKDKDLSVKVNTSTVVNAGFDIRTVIGGATTIRRYGNATTNVTTRGGGVLVPS